MTEPINNPVPSQLPQPKSNITLLGPTPNVIIGYVLRQAIRHFSQRHLIRSESLKDMLWQPDSRSATTMSGPTDRVNTSIQITTYTKFDPAKLGQRPTIIVKDNKIEVMPALSIGDAVHGTTLLIGERGYDADSTAYVCDEERIFNIRGSLTWFCVAQNGAMANELGLEVFNDVLGWQNKILEDANLTYFRVMEKDAVYALRESKDHFVTPIVATYAYTQRYITRAEGPLLKGVFYKANT